MISYVLRPMLYRNVIFFLLPIFFDRTPSCSGLLAPILTLFPLFVSVKSVKPLQLMLEPFNVNKKKKKGQMDFVYIYII